MSGVVELDALLEKLRALLRKEYALPGRACRDVKFLYNELSLMRNVINGDTEHQVREKVNLVREITYDIEDWVDLFTISVRDHGAAAGIWSNTSSRFQGWFRSIARKLTTLLVTLPTTSHGISNELRDLKNRVLHMKWLWQGNEADDTMTVNRFGVIDPRLPALYQKPDSLVGLDGPVEEVTRMLMPSGDMGEAKTVSIVGMVGSGKTTLSHAVYKRLRGCFECQAFVSVTQKPNIRVTLMSMLSQFANVHQQQVEDRDSNRLIAMIRGQLEKKRYLIVLDDLWCWEHWRVINSCFPQNSFGSRIITTRNSALAMEFSKFSSWNDCIYNIGLLSDVDSKQLILNRAVGIFESGCPQDILEDVLLPLIIRRCGGLPLALVTVASMLQYNFVEKKGWEKRRLLSYNNVEWAGFFRSASYEEEVMKWIVNLSYNDLPLNLRVCLLDLSIFPWNSEVDVDRLLRRWNAEGFIAHDARDQLGLISRIARLNLDARAQLGLISSHQKIARLHLDELISRNMVQPLLVNKDGTEYCRLHPVIHDFIVDKSIEENFSTPIHAQRQDAPTNYTTVRRLSLQGSSMEDQVLAQQCVMNLSRARSITVFGQASSAPCLTNLRLVRVLDLEGCVGPVRLEGLDKLVLLRLLSLKGTDVSELPATIGELRCLETLDLRSTKVKELPAIIGQLRCLETLDLGSTKVKELPATIGQLRCLETLDLRSTKVKELPATIGQLRCLETLDVRSTEVKELPGSIVRLRGTLRTLLIGHEGMINPIETATRIPEDIQYWQMLENVGTIDLRVHHASFVKGLGALYHLKVITLIWSFQQSSDAPYCAALISSIGNWSYLESLTIRCGVGCSLDFLGSLSHLPKELKNFKVTAGCFVNVPKWIGTCLRLTILQINVCKLVIEDLKILKGVPDLQRLILGLDFIPREAIVFQSEGFYKLQRLSNDCPVPWLTFQPGAMPKLTHLQLEFCSGPASQESVRVPYGIGNLQSLKEVVLLYNQEWCANSSSVRMTVDAVKRQIAKHSNLIYLIINDIKVDYVQEVGKKATSSTEVQSGDVQQAGRGDSETTVVETCGEIEIEAER